MVSALDSGTNGPGPGTSVDNEVKIVSKLAAAYFTYPSSY